MYDIKREEYERLLHEREEVAFEELIRQLESWVLNKRISIYEVPECVRIQRGVGLFLMARRVARACSWREYYELLKLLAQDMKNAPQPCKRRLAEVLQSTIQASPFEEEQELVIFRKQVEGLIHKALTGSG